MTICVLGASGRLGGMLRAAWQDGAAVWQCRKPLNSDCFAWDMLAGPPPETLVAALRGGVLLCLAGGVPGGRAALEDNTALAEAACDLAVAAGARHVLIASSAAVYGRGLASGAALKEADPVTPSHPYGQAKLEMERAVLRRAQAGPPVTLLRIGNVLGADALLGVADAPELRQIDMIPDASGGPVRSYIGPRRLAQVLRHLCDMAQAGGRLPQILNIAADGAVAMGALLDAAGIEWQYRQGGAAVIPRVVLDTTLLENLMPGVAGPGSAGALVSDWREWKAVTG